MADSTTPESQTPATTSQAPAASQAILQAHSNAIVPHAVADYDTNMVQLNVWTGTKWVNIFDGNDFKNTRADLHQVAKVVETHTSEIQDATKTASDAVKAVDPAVSASKVNSDAIAAQSSAISEAKIALDSATTEIQQTASNAASDAANIRADVATANETLTGQGKQIATINTTLDGLNTKYEGVSDDLSKLSGTVATNSTQIGQNKNSIALKADQSTVANLSGEVSQNTAQLKVQADQISSKVSSEDFNTLDNKVGSAIAQIDKNTTAIDQNSKAITLKADQTTVDKINKTATDNSAAVNVLNNEIKLKVDSTTVNKMIDDKGFTTAKQAQALVDQSATKLSSTITELKTTVDNNGSLINSTNDRLTNVTQAIDGLQTTVKDKANQSQITQLANALQVKLSGSIIAQATDVTLTYTGKENECPPAAPLAGMNDVDKGSTLILSFDYVASDDTKLTPQLDGDPWVPWGTIVNATPAAKGKKGSYSMTITVNDDSWQKGNAKNLCIRCDGFKGTIEITNLVLKYADTALNDVQSSFDMLRDDINLRVTKGDLLSQINIAAGHTLIQSNKIYLDADSVVFGENSKAFIPSAYVTDVNADKITTGILKSIAINNGDGAFTVNPAGDVVANSITVRNGNIFQGQILGAGFYAIDRTTDTNKKFTSLKQVDDSIDTWMKINGQIMEWHGKGDDYASIGPRMPYVKSDQNGGTNENLTKGLTIVGTNGVTISGGSKAEWGNVEPNFRVQTKSNISFALPTNLSVDAEEVKVSLDTGTDLSDDNKKGAQFTIQKDDKLGFYAAQGNNGNQVNVFFGGDDSGFNIFGPLHVSGSKNSVVKTKQGWLAINAYETAEYYFGDIGENNTGEACQVTIGIDQIFNETVNTDITYQVFVTPYSDTHVWVKERYNNRFVVCSDKPNAEFGWELKAKRKGYESNRLRHVNVDVNPLDLKGETN